VGSPLRGRQMGEPSVEEMELLRIRARERITQGRLPRTKAARTWGGLGVGLPCNLCDAAILSSEPEFELQFELSPTSSPFRFHRQCHAIWNEVREEYRPPEWHLVSEQLPPFGVLVEARVSLGETRSIILGLICATDADAGTCTWVNATTRAALPADWRPLEWRHPSGRTTESQRGAAAAVEPRGPPLPRRA
jgi:hypothetical protein